MAAISEIKFNSTENSIIIFEVKELLMKTRPYL